jgi:hypothetical protein
VESAHSGSCLITQVDIFYVSCPRVSLLCLKKKIFLSGPTVFYSALLMCFSCVTLTTRYTIKGCVREISVELLIASVNTVKVSGKMYETDARYLMKRKYFGQDPMQGNRIYCSFRRRR